MKGQVVAPTDKVSIRPGVTARDFDAEWIILDLPGGNYFGLDEIGGIVWNLLAAGKTAEEIARHLESKYHAAEAAILSDVLRLMSELVERGLVIIEPR